MPPSRRQSRQNTVRPPYRPSRFDALPRRTVPQTLNQILRSTHLRQAVDDALVNRADLQFLLHTFDNTVAMQDAILRMPTAGPTAAFHLRPVLQLVESLQTTTIYEMLDHGMQRRLGQIDAYALNGLERPLPFLDASDSENDANITRHVRMANHRLAIIRQNISLIPCPTCDEHNHPPYQCPQRPRSPSQIRPVPPPTIHYSPVSSSEEDLPALVNRPNTPHPSRGTETTVIDLTICPNCGLDVHEDGPCPHTSVEDLNERPDRHAQTRQFIRRQSSGEIRPALDTRPLAERVFGEVQRAVRENEAADEERFEQVPPEDLSDYINQADD